MNPTYYQTVVSSPEWQAWGKVAHDYGYDWDESVETGWLSPKHFAAFLGWCSSHQLQNARQDWLREEIVRLDSMLVKEYMKGSPAQYQNKVILEIMKRYQAELDQPNK